MLVLSRRLDEEIIIDGCITIKVVSVQNGKVRLAITAPPDVTVNRAEIHEQRKQFDTPVKHENATLDLSMTSASL